MRVSGTATLALPLLSAAVSSVALADTLTSNEIRVTNSVLTETTPTLGADATSGVVVFTSRDSSAVGQVYYQRLSKAGLIGPPALVSEGGTDDQLNDVSGDYIVYTSYLSATSDVGQVKLYEISSGATTALSELTTIFEARVHDNMVAWVEGAPGSTRVMLFDIDTRSLGAGPLQIAGPSPAATDVEIGDRLVVWVERVDAQLDVHAYDIATRARFTVAADPLRTERSPSTSGAWVTWQSGVTGVAGIRIEAMNVDTSERRTIADNGAANVSPTIDRDLIGYESNVTGNFDVYLYRLSANDTFQVTNHPADQRLNNVYGDQVAYVDSRDGNADVFVSTFSFAEDPEEDPGEEDPPAPTELDPSLCDSADLPDDVMVLFDGSWASEDCAHNPNKEDCDHSNVVEDHAIDASGDVLFCLSVDGDRAPRGYVRWNDAQIFDNDSCDEPAAAAIADGSGANALRVKLNLWDGTGVHLRLLAVDNRAVLGVSAVAAGESPSAAGCASTPSGAPALLLAALLLVRRRSR
jgi:hypothetical protein